ncbi:MAG: DUF4339 domain-containing protein [Verrucomicrobia bacterium]|nr:DUF4339 domain-containing protein [Verrucomicrobiota bacterium]
MANAASSEWYLRKKGGEEAFGPVSFAQLHAWAESAQISPLDSVSPDGANWQRAPMLAELQMDWLIELGDGALYGPTTLGALREFVRAGDITAESEIIDAVAGSRHLVGELLFGPDLEPSPEPTVEHATAPVRASGGIKENLQQRIRELEERLLEARREAQLWRERCERGWRPEESAEAE